MHPELSRQLSVAEITRFGVWKIERGHKNGIIRMECESEMQPAAFILNFSEIATFSKHQVLYNSGVDKKKEELGEIWICLVFSSWWMCLFFFLMLL